MVKHKTADLEGGLLDAAVAIAEGLEVKPWRLLGGGCEWRYHAEPAWMASADPSNWHEVPRYSSSWADGGPIIERARIMIEPHEPAGKPSNWGALVMESYGHEGPEGEHYASGATPLIAAMRAFVAYKLGDEIDLP